MHAPPILSRPRASCAARARNRRGHELRAGPSHPRTFLPRAAAYVPLPSGRLPARAPPARRRHRRRRRGACADACGGVCGRCFCVPVSRCVGCNGAGVVPITASPLQPRTRRSRGTQAGEPQQQGGYAGGSGYGGPAAGEGRVVCGWLSMPCRFSSCGTDGLTQRTSSASAWSISPAGRPSTRSHAQAAGSSSSRRGRAATAAASRRRRRGPAAWTPARARCTRSSLTQLPAKRASTSATWVFFEEGL